MEGIFVEDTNLEDCSFQGNIFVLNGSDNYREDTDAGRHTVLSNFALNATDATNYSVGTGTVTTINQALMRSDVTVMQDGEIKILPNGDRESDKVKWVHHDKIGYILPEPTNIRISNQVEKGRWSDIVDIMVLPHATQFSPVSIGWINFT